jgi:hydrogenase maturation protease
MKKMDNTDKTLILGIGNFLLGDEGVGVHTIKALEKIETPSTVELLDGGTGGFHLLGLMDAFKRIIIVDATMDESPVGTLKHIVPKYSSDYPPSLSAHDIGLKDLVESMTLLDYKPRIDLITVSVKTIDNLSVELSPEIQLQLPKIVDKVLSLIA